MKKLLVIGAGYLQSFVIKRAKEIGLTVLAVDADKNAVGFKFADKYSVINIVDKEACLAYAQSEQIDGVLTAATDYGVLTASFIAQEMGLPGLNYESAKLIKDKYLVHKRFVDCGVDDTDEGFFADEATDYNALKEKVHFPVMVKPCDGSGSRAASRVDTPDGLECACKASIAASISKKAVIERFITGKEYGAESLVINGEPYVFAIMQKKMTKPPYYAELGHTLPNDLPAETDTKARECVKKALKALNVNFGSVNMDMIITDSGEVHIVDVGARMGGNMIGPCIIPYGTGIDYMKAMLLNAVDEFNGFEKLQPKCVTTRLLAFKDGIAQALPDKTEFERIYGVELYHHIELGQQIHEYHTNLDGLGYIVSVADTLNEANEKADRAFNAVKNIVFGEADEL